jgi:hypothetical protein
MTGFGRNKTQGDAMQRFRNGWARSAVVLGMLFSVGAAVEVTTPAAYAQNAVTGAINGTVVDSTGAVVPNATVTLKDTATGAVTTVTTNGQGFFTAPFLNPHVFDVTASSSGLQSITTSVQVLTGQQSLIKVKVTPTANKQTVQVSANNAQLIDTQSANLTTTFTTKQFEDLPMPGGDITTIAYTLPGVVVNAGTGGYGNFSSDGLPGTSNLVIINGSDDNDPFLNVNNSGSSNLTLGQYEIAQAAVVQNGYSAQYGRQAGAIETYTTKSGTNRVHGLLYYSYNSAGLNANDFFNKQAGNGRAKAVSNQYAAQIGGPIKRDKIFWFVDTEGIRYILPTGAFLNFPTADLQNTILNTVPGGSTGAGATLYGQMFKTLNSAPSAANAVPVTTGNGPFQDASGNLGCGSIAGTPVYGNPNEYFGAVPAGASGVAVPCVNTTFASAENLNREWFAAGRFDWNISEKHKLYARITDDQGRQPTFTSEINPVLDAQSIQPAYSGQLNDTYSITPNAVNQLILTGLYYGAIFEPASIPNTLAASPTAFLESNDAGTNSAPGFGQTGTGDGSIVGFEWNGYPQGRNVTQYQIVDDVSWLKGNHTLKFGGNFKRDDVTDVGNQANTFGGYYAFGDAADFAGGALPGSAQSAFVQNFTNVPTAHSALYNLGLYAQDEWRAKPNFLIDYGLRIDRNGNPACTSNCFSHYVGGFPDPTATLNTPYNQSISINHRSAFPAIEKAVVQPRVGFNWDTKGDGNTVVRGGVGLFADEFPALLIASLYNSFPNSFFPAVFAGNVAQGPGSAPSIGAASFAAVNAGFPNGGSYNTIAASLPAGVPFSAPGYFTTDSTFHTPRYLEYSLQIQRQLRPTDAIIISYAGNHGYDLLINNPNINQQFAGSLYSLPDVTTGNPYPGFQYVPANSPDPRFSEVQKTYNGAKSNYNGLMFQYKHFDHHGLSVDASYTYSHALDDISNVGGLTFNGNGLSNQITPVSPSILMYSSSDFDIRNNFVADVTYVEPYRFANKFEDLGLGGWTVAAKAYWRSGEPFSVFNVNAQNSINTGTGANTVLADVLNNSFNHKCNSYSSPCFQTPGLFNGQGVSAVFNNAGVFQGTTPVGPGPSPQLNFGNTPRNSFYGPHYTDVDLSVYKDVLRMSAAQFQLGVQAYNVLNHVNFGFPQSNASNLATLGKIQSDISPPTSPYGSFQGSVVSGRVLVVQGRLTF